ncbi:uncharacterized protein LOC141718541 [Apium graveolens]|uniref:uncharacterized protein LOC141718541 n=1 Tax=Apium graveolens TaxID=4045 RepID=UPI003D793CB3
MAEASLLAKPSSEDTLYLYFAVSEQAVSAVLVKEEQKLQKHVYYVSKVLHGAELNYSTIEKSALGLVLKSPEGFMIEYVLKLDFPTTNNEAEYEALIAGLGLARAVRSKNLKVCGDSRLVVSQINGDFEAKDDTMAKYLRVINLITLVGVASCWIDPIKTHLETGWLPDDAQEARKLSVRALRYLLIEGLLYKRSFVILYLKCLRPLEVEEALKEAHEGICGQHLGGRALTHKIAQLGFYWPVMLADAKAYVKKCDRYQRHVPIVRQPLERLTSISTPIHFAMWGMAILGPFPVASGQRKFIVVAIDYFTKWIEAKALAKITTKKIAQFFWENVICRYGIQRILVTDNGKQFDNAKFREYCDDNNIELRFTSVAHPQENGYPIHARLRSRGSGAP